VSPRKVRGARSSRPAPPFTVEVVDRRRRKSGDARDLGAFLTRLAAEVPPPPGSRVVLCLLSDPAMRTLNRTFRGKRGTTDVLAFPGDEPRDPEGRFHLGDIAVSVPRAARQAREEGHALSRELRILALHGYLHLLGHDHERDRGEMMRLESRLIRGLVGERPRGRA
jgi:probable rRNA maturation factor